MLDLDFKDPAGGNGVTGNPGFAILGHSSALTARPPLMRALTPRERALMIDELRK